MNTAMQVSTGPAIFKRLRSNHRLHRHSKLHRTTLCVSGPRNHKNVRRNPAGVFAFAGAGFGSDVQSVRLRGLSSTPLRTFAVDESESGLNRPRTNLPVSEAAGFIAQWKFRLGSADYLQELLVVDDDGRFDGKEV